MTRASRAADSAARLEDTKRALAGMFPELVGYFSRRLGNLEDAADAASMTVVELLARPRRVPLELSALRQYAYGTARHVLARVRKGRLRDLHLADQMKIQLRVQDQSIHIPDDRGLADALGRLSFGDQELLLMVAWEGFGIAEAGAILGLRPEAARKRYSRIRLRLRSELGAAEEVGGVRSSA
jgi:RNA polymerase sigma factor (sigma-70 family)